jgi:hypothetical protein
MEVRAAAGELISSLPLDETMSLDIIKKLNVS